jgi:hypothetical protein
VRHILNQVSNSSRSPRRCNGELVSTDDIAGRLIDAKGFDAADSVLRAAIRDQALTTLRAFRRRGTVQYRFITETNGEPIVYDSGRCKGTRCGRPGRPRRSGRSNVEPSFTISCIYRAQPIEAFGRCRSR